jgi:hypothetical protein
MPGFVELNYVFPFTGSFVVDYYVLVLRVFPEVVDSAEDQEISGLMEVLDTGEVVAPGVEMLVRYRNGVNAVMFHQRVFGPLGSVKVKFFLEESINCRVQGKGKSGRSADPESAIHIEAAWTFSKKINLAPAQFERRRRARGINVF